MSEQREIERLSTLLNRLQDDVARLQSDIRNIGSSSTSISVAQPAARTVAHSGVTGVTANQHHTKNHASRHAPTQDDPVLLDEDDMATDSDLLGATQQSIKAFIAALKLNQIQNPNADVNWQFATKHLHITFTSPTTEAGVILELLGNTSGRDLLHLHQHTGNPTGETRLQHLEWDHENVIPVRWKNGDTEFYLYFDMIAPSEDRLITYPDKDLSFAVDTVAEAIAAMGAEADDNPLNHDRTVNTDVAWNASRVSQAEAETGTETIDRKWTAERVKQAIDSLGGGGGVSAHPDLTDKNTEANIQHLTAAQIGALHNVITTLTHTSLTGKNSEANIKHLTDAQITALHDEYTDAEVDAIVLTHKNNASAHHIKTTNTDVAWNASTVSEAEAQAGTSTTTRKWTAQRVAQAIAALSGGGITEAQAVQAVEDAGLVLSATKVITSADADLAFTFGRTRIDSRVTDEMTISHRDVTGNNDYAIKQISAGHTYINAKTGKSIYISINGSSVIQVVNTGIAVSGDITVSGTVDGVDIAARDHGHDTYYEWITTDGAMFTNSRTIGNSVHQIQPFTNIVSASAQNNVYYYWAVSIKIPVGWRARVVKVHARAYQSANTRWSELRVSQDTLASSYVLLTIANPFGVSSTGVLLYRSGNLNPANYMYTWDDNAANEVVGITGRMRVSGTSASILYLYGLSLKIEYTRV